MKALGGLFFQGATLTEYDDVAPGTGSLGTSVWGRSALLAHLELRLGLPSAQVAHGIRLQGWSRRLSELAAVGQRFYSKSYEVDPIGTAGTLLQWRDSLVDAGWNGELITDGGTRLETLRELESGAQLPLGAPDRLHRVEKELRLIQARWSDSLDLAEPREVWPGRWRRVFAFLEERGASVTTVPAAFPSSRDARDESDLGRLKASLRGGAPTKLCGDGSLLVLRGETSWELAHVVASWLRESNDEHAVVIRGGDRTSLDLALATQGLASQGVQSHSTSRPVLQVLPLAVELAFEPRDPYRVLELLTLPFGPFAGFVGRELAGALSEAPGIGGRPWLAAKAAIVERVKQWAEREAAPEAAEDPAQEHLEKIAAWLEGVGHDSVKGAPRSALLEVSARVTGWFQNRIAATAARASEDSAAELSLRMLGTAFAQAQAFHDALSHDPRERLDLVAARQLLQEVSAGGLTFETSVEEAGRIDVVDRPAGLRRERDLVVWWHCVGGTESGSPPLPWRTSERQALNRAGIHFADPTAVLAAEAKNWHQPIFAAKKRLLLVVPGSTAGESLEPHPVWDEIVARFRASSVDTAKITVHSRDLLAQRKSSLGLPNLHVEELSPLALPDARAVWHLNGAHLAAATRHSASSLQSLLGCPLQWVFRYRAGLNSGRGASIASGPLLNGKIGHRLVEELHLQGGFADANTVGDKVRELLERMLREEASVLLRPGAVFELSQLREQLVASISRLAELLIGSKLSIAGVEMPSRVPWGSRELDGRLDLLLTDSEGKDVVVDLKWGRRSYLNLLESGLAIQLAVYARARQLSSGAASFPAAGYFSLSRGELLTTEKGTFKDVRVLEGPKISETWTKLEHTVTVVERMLEKGDVPVTGVGRALPLLTAAGISESHHDRHLEPEPACGYCEHATLCGRAWEGFA